MGLYKYIYIHILNTSVTYGGFFGDLEVKILHRDVKPALGELRDDLLGSFWVRGEVGCWVILRAAYIYMKQVEYFICLCLMSQDIRGS